MTEKLRWQQRLTSKGFWTRSAPKMSGDRYDSIPVVPETGAKKKNDSLTGAGDFEFRPLTQEEKQEFVNSLDAKGRQVLAELESKLKVSSDSAA
ncbi:MAG: hypothetical protein WAU74_15010 [Pseudolabrys sp.]